MQAFSPIPGRKIRSNKGKIRAPYTDRKTPSKCVTAFLNGTLLRSRFGSPYVLTPNKNRYNCQKQLDKRKKKNGPLKPKPTIKASQYKKGTVRNGWIVKMIKKGAGSSKQWRRDV